MCCGPERAVRRCAHRDRAALLRKLQAGLFDAGASSLATFAAGISATRLMNAPQLGIYALFFAAWILALQLPSQLILVPAEARLVYLPAEDRKSFLITNTILALPFALLGSAMVLAVLLVLPQSANRSIALQLGVTAALAATLYPLQENARRLLHLSRLHWAAASLSIVRLIVAAVVLVIGWRSELPIGLLPFGSLAAGDLVALIVAFFIIKPKRHKPEYHLRSLITSGRWLLLSASLGPAAGFAVGVLVTHLADSAALGVAEAARIVAQPVLVLAIGLETVLRPAAMEAAIEGQEGAARRLSRRLGLGLTGAAGAYMVLALVPSSVIPFHDLFPKAFSLPGLVHLAILAAFLEGVVLLKRSELIALDRTMSLSVAEAGASTGRIGVAVPAGFFQSWTVPLGSAVAGLIRWVSYSRLLSKAYERAHQGD